MTGDRGIEPVRRTHAQARDLYDRVSRAYDWVEGPFERAARSTGLDMLDVRAGERVVDIGHGTGHALAALARRAQREGGGGLVVGVDLAPGMQRVARRRLAAAGLDRRPALARADAVALPFRSGCLDAAFMSFVLELFDTPEIPAVLGEARRVLRPGGRLGVVALGWSDRPGPVARLYLAGHRRFPRLLDCRPIPTAAVVRAAGYEVVAGAATGMWGLPVDVVVATRP